MASLHHFVLPFTMSLLCIMSTSNLTVVFSQIDKLKPIFDTYTAPFKDKAQALTRTD